MGSGACILHTIISAVRCSLLFLSNWWLQFSFLICCWCFCLLPRTIISCDNKLNEKCSRKRTSLFLHWRLARTHRIIASIACLLRAKQMWDAFDGIHFDCAVHEGDGVTQADRRRSSFCYVFVELNRWIVSVHSIQIVGPGVSWIGHLFGHLFGQRFADSSALITPSWDFVKFKSNNKQSHG